MGLFIMLIKTQIGGQSLISFIIICIVERAVPTALSLSLSFSRTTKHAFSFSYIFTRNKQKKKKEEFYVRTSHYKRELTFILSESSLQWIRSQLSVVSKPLTDTSSPKASLALSSVRISPPASSFSVLSLSLSCVQFYVIECVISYVEAYILQKSRID